MHMEWQKRSPGQFNVATRAKEPTVVLMVFLHTTPSKIGSPHYRGQEMELGDIDFSINRA